MIKLTVKYEQIQMRLLHLHVREREFTCQENNNTVIICYNKYNGRLPEEATAYDIQRNNNYRY